MAAPPRILLASSNDGKLREFRALAAGHAVQIDLLPSYESTPAYEEDALSFAENAAGKVVYYSRKTEAPVLADDSGLVVPALGGRPGVHSARYAGPSATSKERIEKLLLEMKDLTGNDRTAKFVCVLAFARRGQVQAIFSAEAEGEILQEPRGESGFGYDPIFLCRGTNHTFAEIRPEEKNRLSHRGQAFRRLLCFLEDPAMLLEL